LNIAETYHHYAFAPPAFDLDAMGNNLREQVAAFTAMRRADAGSNGALHRRRRVRNDPTPPSRIVSFTSGRHCAGNGLA